MIAYLFQIHSLTPIKYAWLAFLALNVAISLALAVRRGPLAFRVYMACAAASMALQKSPLWGMWGEYALLVTGSIFAGSLLRHLPGKTYALMIGLAFLGVLIWVIPHPWPLYSHGKFYARLYSSMACCALLLGGLTWEWRRPPARTLIAAVWFVPPMIASASVNWDVAWWNVQMVNTAIWTACLLGWFTATASESPAVRG